MIDYSHTQLGDLNGRSDEDLNGTLGIQVDAHMSELPVTSSSRRRRFYALRIFRFTRRMNWRDSRAQWKARDSSVIGRSGGGGANTEILALPIHPRTAENREETETTQLKTRTPRRSRRNCPRLTGLEFKDSEDILRYRNEIIDCSIDSEPDVKGLPSTAWKQRKEPGWPRWKGARGIGSVTLKRETIPQLLPKWCAIHQYNVL